MHTCRRTIIATSLMLALQLVALSSWAFAQRPINLSGAVSTFAADINAASQIVGGYTDTSNRTHGFVLPQGLGGAYLSLDFPGAVSTQASGINAAGQIV